MAQEAAVAAAMENFSLEEEEKASTHTIATTSAAISREKGNGDRQTTALASPDGFSYQKSSLQEYIAHCAGKGQPLTSPLTGEPMGVMKMPIHHVQTFVKD